MRTSLGKFFTPPCVPPCEGGKERDLLVAATPRYEIDNSIQGQIAPLFQKRNKYNKLHKTIQELLKRNSLKWTF